MKINNSIFLPGKVNYNEFNIDFSQDLKLQYENLNEDLVQVEYGKGYILDIGWYPECDETGCVIVQFIHNKDWTTPIVKKECNNMSAILNCISEIKRMIGHNK